MEDVSDFLAGAGGLSDAPVSKGKSASLARERRHSLSAWQRVLDQVAMCRHEMGCTRTGALFRGHGRAEWPLVPGVIREGFLASEAHLFDEFFTRAHRNGIAQSSSWDLLTLMQHHGAPTRLLDWTDSFAVALFFAIRDGGESPTVWIMNAFRLTQASVGKPMIFTLGVDQLPDYYDSFIRARSWPHRLPIVVEPKWSIQRLHAQKGCFTIHGNDPSSIESSSSRFVRSVTIPPDAIAGAEDFLSLAGIDECTLFPDLDGLARWLRRKYKPKAGKSAMSSS